MKAAGVAYLAGLVGIAIDGRIGQVALFVSCALAAAVVRLFGRGRCRSTTGRAKRFCGG